MFVSTPSDYSYWQALKAQTGSYKNFIAGLSDSDRSSYLQTEQNRPQKLAKYFNYCTQNPELAKHHTIEQINALFTLLCMSHKNKELSDYHFLKVLCHHPQGIASGQKNFDSGFEKTFISVTKELTKDLDNVKNWQRVKKLYQAIQRNSKKFQNWLPTQDEFQVEVSFVKNALLDSDSEKTDPATLENQTNTLTGKQEIPQNNLNNNNASSSVSKSIYFNRFLLGAESKICRYPLFSNAWNHFSNRPPLSLPIEQKHHEILAAYAQGEEKVASLITKLSNDDLLELMHFAREQDLMRFAAICADEIVTSKERITSDNVMQMLHFAYEYNLIRLRSHCSQHLEDICNAHKKNPVFRFQWCNTFFSLKHSFKTTCYIDLDGWDENVKTAVEGLLPWCSILNLPTHKSLITRLQTISGEKPLLEALAFDFNWKFNEGKLNQLFKLFPSVNKLILYENSLSSIFKLEPAVFKNIQTIEINTSIQDYSALQKPSEYGQLENAEVAKDAQLFSPINVYSKLLATFSNLKLFIIDNSGHMGSSWRIFNHDTISVIRIGMMASASEFFKNYDTEKSSISPKNVSFHTHPSSLKLPIPIGAHSLIELLELWSSPESKFNTSVVEVTQNMFKKRIKATSLTPLPPVLKELSIITSSDWTDSAFLAIPALCPSLETFDLTHTAIIEPETIFKLLHPLKKLTTLRLSCRVENPEIFLSHVPFKSLCLETLALVFDLPMPPSKTLTLLDELKQLKHLKLGSCDSEVLAHLAKEGQNLLTLELSPHLSVKEENLIDFVTRLPKLQELRLNNVSHLEANTFDLLNKSMLHHNVIAGAIKRVAEEDGDSPARKKQEMQLQNSAKETL